MMGATKQGELSRTAEMLPDILKKNGLSYVVWFLLDCQHTREDMKIIAELLYLKELKL